MKPGFPTDKRFIQSELLTGSQCGSVVSTEILDWDNQATIDLPTISE